MIDQDEPITTHQVILTNIFGGKVLGQGDDPNRIN